MRYYCDTKRHLVCLPYSVENLHKMAEDLGINRCFYELSNNGRLRHYDIPKNRIAEITAKCSVVNFRDIVRIIKSGI